MSSDLLFDLDGFIFPSDFDQQFLYDPFVPLPELPIDIIQPISDEPTTGQFPSASHPLSSSPPSKQINNLSLCPKTHLQSLPTAVNSADGIPDFSVLDALGVKSEQCYVGFDSSHIPSFPANNYGIGNSIGLLQRSLSGQSLDPKWNCFFQPSFNSLLESPNFQTQFMESPENSKFTGPMRRVCSTGDLQRVKRTQSWPLAAEMSLIEESSFKVGRYSAEEKKQRIQRYRNKRTQRNFNKTIKYSCRKTLADSRPRVRGRFARNDEIGEIPKSTGFNRNEEEEEEFGEWFNEEDNEETMRRGQLCNSFSATQFQYYGF